MTFPKTLGPAAALAIIALGGCEPVVDGGAESAGETTRALAGTLEWAIAGPWRTEEERARDDDLHLVEVLDFFRIGPDSAVVETWPGAGWRTSVLAPYLAHGGGRYVAALAPGGDPALDELEQRFTARFSNAEVFGEIEFSELSAESGALTAPVSVDVVVSFRNVHAWMALGFAEKAFADFHAALRPGGYLGIVEARAPEFGPQDPGAASGYVQESYVRRLAQEAGFEFIEASEVSANPADDGDHPFGVWTLAPYGRTSPLGEDPDAAFDRSEFASIGEPDRMTLLFRKAAP